MKKHFIALLGAIPENSLKSFVRKSLLKIYSGLPPQLMAGKGDTVLLAGIRHPKSVSTWVDTVGENGQLILVEADKRNINTLKSHIKNMEYKNIIVVECALGKANGEAKFLISNRPSDNRLRNDGIKMDNDLRGEYSEEITIPVKSIDAIVTELKLQKIDYISLTINGAEAEAIEGMKVSSHLVNRVYSKAHAIDETTNQPINQQISHALESFGFTACIAKTTPGIVSEWDVRAGDVYAWKH